MTDAACIAFLQAVLPRLQMRWPGFRRVRRQVCKRLGRRLRALDLPTLNAYRDYLDAHPEEWAMLDALCRITISRFYRDRGVFDRLGEAVLPALAGRALARGATALRAWSAGCASGEEVYTLAILWRRALAHRFPDLPLQLTATDADAHLLERARHGCYPRGTLRELPAAWVDAAFVQANDAWCLRPAYRSGITWLRQDLRDAMPDGPFDLICCRNLVFTYFAEPLQRTCLAGLAERLHRGGALVLGQHEALPHQAPGIDAWDAPRRIYRRTPANNP